jgi:predicted Zn-dependent protease
MVYLRKISKIVCIFIIISGVLSSNISSGITIKEEEKLGREYMKILTANLQIVDDPMIADYINILGRKLVAAFPQQPFSYNFFVVQEEVYNAFAIPAGNIFIYTGLIAAMESEEELAGILSHEISHVYCRHISQKIDRSKRLNWATMAGVAAGILLGMAGGGEAASAVTVGSMAAGQSAALAYSRADEIQADQIGLEYLAKAGYNGEGLMTVLNKIRAKQWYGTDQIPSYLMTHPAVEDRLAYIDTQLAKRKTKPEPAAGSSFNSFPIVHTKIVALYSDETVALRTFQGAVENKPQDPLGYYGLGLALARSGNREKAIGILQKAQKLNAFSPEILTALGRVYYQDGRYPEALATLEGAVSIATDNAESLFYLGRTQLETGNLKGAEASFSALLKKKPVNRQVFYFLGKTYGRQGNLAEAHYYLGIFQLQKRDFRAARIQFARALEKTQDPTRREEIEKVLKKIDDQLAALKKQQQQR